MSNPFPLACAVLLHTPPPESGEPTHFDLLVEPPVPFPGADAGRLWTARMDRAPGDWPRAGGFPLTPLPPHRRDYLTYEGPVSGNRGTVKRVDEGEATARCWTADVIELDLRLRGFVGTLRMRRIDGANWMGEVSH